jgi:predicted glycogen debranching enzyme
MQFTYKKTTDLTLTRACSLEWLETNGLGGYASSSILNCNTRKYHGLLVTKISGLPDKYVLLSKLEDVLLCDDKEYFLSAHQYLNYFEQGSFANFQEFTLDNHPCFRYKFDDLLVEKEILLRNDEDTVFIKYKIIPGNKRVKLRLRPFLAMRNFHALSKENSSVNTLVKMCKNGLLFNPYKGMPSLFLQCDAAFKFTEENIWYRNFYYQKERERGYDCTEDLFSPAAIELNIAESSEIVVSCSLHEQMRKLADSWNIEVKRREDFANAANNKDTALGVYSGLQKQLKKAAESFIIKTKDNDNHISGLSIVAGYHWFLEWGRDAMISLPGLTLYSGMEKECLMILKEFALHEQHGMIPNFFGPTKEQDAFNSVDAALWFVWAVQQYYTKTNDSESIAKFLWQAIKNIFYNYKNGTLHNIKMQDNGLIYAGSADVNLTWMDAEVAGKPVTPRYGFQVEVNALWHNLLNFIKILAEIFSDPIKNEVSPLIAKVRESFIATFWDVKLGYLYDFVNAELKSAAIRPNQIFAVSLPFPLLGEREAYSVINTVTTHLLTPYGLRTLSPLDPNYCGAYAGSQEERDRAYHNGTVWTWLLCHFAQGWLAVTVNKKYILSLLQPCLEALQSSMREDGIGTISEIFSGNVPHAANGCISQAWSIAEILRLTYLLEDL